MECCQRGSGGASAGSVTGGRGQGTGESLTVTEVSLSPSLCPLMGMRSWAAKTHSGSLEEPGGAWREPGERRLGQFA